MRKGRFLYRFHFTRNHTGMVGCVDVFFLCLKISRSSSFARGAHGEAQICPPWPVPDSVLRCLPARPPYLVPLPLSAALLQVSLGLPLFRLPSGVRARVTSFHFPQDALNASPSSYFCVFFDRLGLYSFPQYQFADPIWPENSQYPPHAYVLEYASHFRCHLPALGSLYQYWFYFTVPDVHLGLHAVNAGFQHLIQ